jgi:hypothetical protein
MRTTSSSPGRHEVDAKIHNIVVRYTNDDAETIRARLVVVKVWRRVFRPPNPDIRLQLAEVQ